MIINLLPLLVVLGASSGPTPSPPADASPTLRGMVNVDPTQRLHGKTFVDKVTVNVDAGVAIASTCVPLAALGACPVGNALQCVLDAGWYGCQVDGGWAQLGAGGGVTAVTGAGPIASSGGATPAISCAFATAADGGCLSATDWSTFNGKESALTFSGPLSRTSNTISLPAADPATSGYVSTGTQSFAGLKNFSSLDAGALVATQASVQNLAPVEIDAPVPNAPIELVGSCNTTTTGCAAIDFNNTAPVSSNLITKWSSGGVMVARVYNDGTYANYPATISTHIVYADQIQDPTGVSGVIAMSDRSATSAGADFSVDTAVVRTVGALLQVRNAGSPVAAVDPTGMVIGGVGGVGSFASFQDGTGVSGHPSLTCAPGLYTVILGRLEDDHAAIETDGGKPISDGGTDVCVETDGGTYYCYAGKHGDTTILDSAPRYSGWNTQWENPTGGQGIGAYIDYQGAFGQYGGLTLANFGGPSRLILTSAGQFYEGEFESSLRYAEGSGGNEHHYFVQGPANPDGGTSYIFSGPGGQWRQLPYADEVVAWSSGPNGTPSAQTMKSDNSIFSSGAKLVTLGASQQFASTPDCWCNDTATASAGSPVGCQYDVANSTNAIVAFVGTGAHNFHWWCTGK